MFQRLKKGKIVILVPDCAPHCHNGPLLEKKYKIVSGSVSQLATLVLDVKSLLNVELTIVSADKDV